MKKFVILGLIIGLVIALGGFVFIESRGKKPTLSESEKNQEELLSIKQRTGQDINFINQSIISLSADYKKFSGEDKKEAFSVLKEQAELRKKEMLNLAQNDPAKFLSSVMPQKVVKTLPAELQSNFEKEVIVSGRLEEIIGEDFTNKTSETFYSITNKKNESIDFFPVGEKLGLVSGEEVKVRGYQLESNLVAPISKNTFETLPTNGNAPSSFNIKSQFIVPVVEAATPDTIGEQKIAVILLKSGQFEFLKKEDIRDFMNIGKAQNFYNEVSYGNISLKADVFGWYTLPSGTDLYFEGNNLNSMLDIAISLSDADINFNDYERIVLILEGSSSRGWAVRNRAQFIRSQDGDNLVSVAWLSLVRYPDPNSWAYDYLNRNEYVILHELGHNLGLAHADRWFCDGPPTDPFYGATCRHEEYGNNDDVMGFAGYSLHFNAGYKDYFGWFDANSILNITASGRYTLKPLESNLGVRAIKIIPPKKIDNTTFYVETRRAIGFDSSLTNVYGGVFANGVFINQFRPQGGGRTTGPDTRLISMGTRKSKPDGFNMFYLENLIQGDELYDFSTYGIKIGPVVSDSADSTTFDIILDVAPLPPCVRQGPIVTVMGTDDLIKTIPGNIRLFPLSFKSADSASCVGINFQTSVMAPIGWTVSVMPDQTNIFLAPDEVGTKNIQVEAPMTAAPGTYEVIVTVKNTDGDLAVESKIQYRIVKEFNFNFIHNRKIRVKSVTPEPAPIPKAIDNMGVIFEVPEGASSDYELGDE